RIREGLGVAVRGADGSDDALALRDLRAEQREILLRVAEQPVSGEVVEAERLLDRALDQLGPAPEQAHLVRVAEEAPEGEREGLPRRLPGAEEQPRHERQQLLAGQAIALLLDLDERA